MTVKQNHPFQNGFSSAGWQILGELELPVEAEASGSGDVWLAETLMPLKLHADFLDKVLESAQEAIARLSHPMKGVMAFEHIHILVFIPTDSSSKGQNWGFFRIEKIEGVSSDEIIPGHAIGLFLYREEG